MRIVHSSNNRWLAPVEGCREFSEGQRALDTARQRNGSTDQSNQESEFIWTRKRQRRNSRACAGSARPKSPWGDYCCTEDRPLTWSAARPA